MWVGVGLFLYVWFDGRLGLSREKEKTRGENVTPAGYFAGQIGGYFSKVPSLGAKVHLSRGYMVIKW